MLRRAVESGANHIDTAQFYGPNVANELIREALHPYPDDLALVISAQVNHSRRIPSLYHNNTSSVRLAREKPVWSGGQRPRRAPRYCARTFVGAPT